MSAIRKLQRLTRESLQFRVTVSALSAEQLPQVKKAYLVWTRGSKTVSTKHAQVHQGQVEWADELTQVVTLYFKIVNGNLEASKKEYSLKVKDSESRQTVAKTVIDLSEYCRLESFKRSWVEEKLNKGKLYLLISTELVDSDTRSQDSGSPSLRDSFSGDNKLLDASEDQMKAVLMGSVGVEDDRHRGKALNENDDALQEAIDVLRSSSESDEKEDVGKKWWQVTPRPRRRHTVTGLQTLETKTKSVEIGTSRCANVEPRNLFGSASTDMSNDLYKLRNENTILKSQCDNLTSENAVLKRQIQKFIDQAQTPSSPSVDALDQLIETKIRLAEAQSTILELRSKLRTRIKPS